MCYSSISSRSYIDTLSFARLKKPITLFVFLISMT